MDILKRDVVAILEESKDIVDKTTYKGDLANEMTYGYNVDGTFTYSTYLAREALKNYTDMHPDLLADIVNYYNSDLGMCIGGNFFNKPEMFQVQILIEVVRCVLFADSDMDKWLNDENEYVEDEGVYRNLIDKLIEKISDNDFDLSSFLLD